MNLHQTELFRDLMTLCHPGQDSFYYVDQSMGSDLYRIFLYRLASYTEFLQPGALECRGHVFRIDADGNALEMASYPPRKFFNHGENPFVMGLDLSTMEQVMDKLDGSLISTVISASDDTYFFLKSKGSFYSEQARAAQRLLDTDEYEELRLFCEFAARDGLTVNMEYMAPDNRIVIGYMKPTLKVLNVRSTLDGSYAPVEFLHATLHSKFVVDHHNVPEDGEAWLESVYKSQDDIEGYVVRLSCGTWFKVKTEKYCALHHTKDSITIPRRLFETCVKGGADDLRAMFASDALAVQQIDEMQAKVQRIYNFLHMTIYSFHAMHKHQERKDYAIAGQSDSVITENGVFGLVMNLYLNKGDNLEEFMIKNYKRYGIKDEAPAEVAE